MLIDQNLQKKSTNLASLKSDVDELYIHRLNNVPSGIKSTNLKSEVDKLDADKLVVLPVYLSKLSDTLIKL